MAADAATAPGGLTLRGYPVLLPRLRDPRLHLAAVITSLQVLGQVGFGFRVSIAQILISLATCAVLEVAIAFWRQRVILWPASALITGNGVAFILRLPGTRHGDWWSLNGWWIYAATAAVSLLSKHVLKLRGAHVFNPSNFGLVLCFLVLGSGRAKPLDFWWGPASGWLVAALAIIVVGGLVILSRLHLLRIAVAFWLAFAAAIGVLAATGHAMTASWHVGPISGGSFWWVLVSSPEILVFLFFMLADPKTIPATPRGRVAYAVAVGLLASLLIAPGRTEFWSKVAVLGALAIVCGARPLLERLPAIRLERRRLALVAALALAGYTGAIALAGIPARAPAIAPPLAYSGRFPHIAILPSKGVQTVLDAPTSRRIARDLLADLELQANALSQRRPGGLARTSTGDELNALDSQVRAAKGGAIEAPAYRIDRVSVHFEAGHDQGPAIAVAALAGTVQMTAYKGVPPVTVRRDARVALRETLELQQNGGRWLVARVRSGRPVALGTHAPVIRLVASSGLSAAQGVPFAFRTTIPNRSQVPVVAIVSFSLSAPKPDRRSVAFQRNTVVIPPSGSVAVAGSVTSAQWFSERGSFQIQARAEFGDSTYTSDPLTFQVVAPSVIVPVFQDVTPSAGLTTSIPDGSCGHWTNGAAWADVNGDGYPDLVVTRGNLPVQLFMNDGHGHFHEEAAVRGLDNHGETAQGAVFADYDNDGAPDLYILNDGPNRLFDNDGTGHFTDVTPQAGVAGDPGNISSSASFGDYNNDGHLDLFVSNHSRCLGNSIQQGLRYVPDKLYRNNGDGTFTDVTSLLGSGATKHGPAKGASFQAAWFDYNGDGRPDLYLANDYLGQSPDANHLWRNSGPASGGGWQFTDISSSSGAGLAMNTMGIAVGDYDNDGRLDLALSNIGGNKLLHNNGDGTFTDVAGPAGVSRPEQRLDQKSVTWGTVFADFTNDGWEDLYFAAGPHAAYPADSGGPQPNELFVNEGNGRFADLSAPSGANDPGKSRGVALADYARDGRIDILVVDQGGSVHLYRNVTPMGNRHWLEVNTIGTVSNRDGCGARLTLTVGKLSMLREVFCGSTSVSSGSDKVVHFGLGTANRVTQLVIDWPSGVHQVLRNLTPDRLINVTEP